MQMPHLEAQQSNQRLLSTIQVRILTSKEAQRDSAGTDLDVRHCIGTHYRHSPGGALRTKWGPRSREPGWQGAEFGTTVRAAD